MSFSHPMSIVKEVEMSERVFSQNTDFQIELPKKSRKSLGEERERPTPEVNPVCSLSASLDPGDRRTPGLDSYGSRPNSVGKRVGFS